MKKTDKSAFGIFATLHPVECYRSYPKRFWRYFHKKYPHISHKQLEKIVKEEMKPLLLTLLLSLSLAGFGQIKNDSIEFFHQPIYDTIAIVMLVSDTTAMDQVYWTLLGNGLIQKETVSVVSNEIWQMVGYEVSKFVGNEWISTGSNLMAKLTPIYEHVAYLDHAKNPLNLCVWGTKERKE